MSASGIATTPNPPVAGQAFSFTISGNGFDPATVSVQFSGGACNVPCKVGNAQLAGKTATSVAGSYTLPAAGDYTVEVLNAAPGGGVLISNALSLTVGWNKPSASGIATTPNPPVAGQAFSFTISGNGFDPATVSVQFSGGACNVPCKVGNAQLAGKTATSVAGSYTLAADGFYIVEVLNAAPGGGVVISNALNLTVAWR